MNKSRDRCEVLRIIMCVFPCASRCTCIDVCAHACECLMSLLGDFIVFHFIIFFSIKGFSLNLEVTSPVILSGHETQGILLSPTPSGHKCLVPVGLHEQLING